VSFHQPLATGAFLFFFFGAVDVADAATAGVNGLALSSSEIAEPFNSLKKLFRLSLRFLFCYLIHSIG
jgi:hypothetical protein